MLALVHLSLTFGALVGLALLVAAVVVEFPTIVATNVPSA
jgi:hypothetical protein